MGDRAQVKELHRAGHRVQEEDPHQVVDQVRAQDLEQVGDLEQEEHQNLHFVLFLVHKQNQLKDLE